MEPKDLISRCGGVVKFARSIGLKSHTPPLKWKKIPVHHVRKIASLTGIPPEQLRPDVFGPETTHERGAA